MRASNPDNWQDGGQALLGAGLIISGASGGISLVGGTFLFGWELYEMMTEN